MADKTLPPCPLNPVPFIGVAVATRSNPMKAPGTAAPYDSPQTEPMNKTGITMIDIHSHLLPGIDDGCGNLAQSIESVRRLKDAGFCGTICTPHVQPNLSRLNTPAKIEAWTADLAAALREAGIEYDVWPGGELRLHEGVIEWVKIHGVPTMAGSRCVLADFWIDDNPPWILDAIRWFFDNGYQPVLAHPERLAPTPQVDDMLETMLDLGVWFQGNLRCLTGEDGYRPDRRVRAFLEQDRYRFMALDMHAPDSLPGRLDGVGLFETEFGASALRRLMCDAPRELILQVAQV
jgi:protein-tyrosine phosphatase